MIRTICFFERLAGSAPALSHNATMQRQRSPESRRLAPAVLAVWAVLACTAPAMRAQGTGEPPLRLHGHVLNALQYATRLPRTSQAASEQVTLTVMLNWSDPAGFKDFGDAFEDAASPSYHKMIGADELTARFGPSQEAYDTVLSYLQRNGFALVLGSANRLTLTIRGTRVQAERTFSVSIDDYQLGADQFHANDTEPAIPATLAPLIRSVSGFSNLGRPQPANAPSPLTPMSIATAYNRNLPRNIDGSGQTIGLIEFDNFNYSDIANWLKQVNLPAGLINHVSTYNINGGTQPSGQSGTSEALMDIDAVLGMAPGATVAVFVAPNQGDGGYYLSVMNSAINQIRALTGGYGGIISTSWSRSEDGQDGVTDQDADAMNGLLQFASYYGLTVFAASGDYGNSSVDTDSNGNVTKTYPNRVTFPADTPYAVAVGGTTLNVVGASNSYQSESWWTNGKNGSKGNGSYGYSWHFSPVPKWQTPFTNAFGRSVPDVSASADWNYSGILICQGMQPNGSPNCGGDNGGTSLAAPLWAGVWALTNQVENNARGTVTTASGGYLYSLFSLSSTGNSFHSWSTMTGAGNDFSHVGLGSPNIANLLSHVAGPPSITSISPASGPATGGTQVTINGKAFIGVSQVLFQGVSAVSFNVVSDTQIVAFSPAASQNAPEGDIRVITPAGTSSSTNADVFGYSAVITWVSPNNGPIDGGMTLTVSGVGFQRVGGGFYVGGVPARSFNCSGSDTVCQVVTPAHSAGTVDVTLGAVSPSSTDRFTYVVPSIDSISPLIGPTTGGTQVTLYGRGLSPNMIVKFGATLADQRTVSCSLDDTACTVVSPAWAPPTAVCSVCADAHPNAITTTPQPSGVASVVISATVSNVTSRLLANDEFTYAIFPEIHSLSQSSGSPAGGTQVTVKGANFSTLSGGTTFMFGSNAATNVQCSFSTLCTITSPAWNSKTDPKPQVVVTATVNWNTSQSIGLFTYNAPAPPPPPPPPPPKGPPPCYPITSCQ
jgi:hypothetical protein